MGFLEMILPVLLVFLSISKLYRLLIHLIWRPYAITKSFKEQGVSGPSYFFFSGSINEMKSIKLASEDHVLDIHCHDITATVFPEYCRWRSEYGKFASLWLELNDAGCKLSCLICGTGETFLHWFGPEPMLCISNPEQIKQVMANKFGFYVKPEPKASLFSLFGRGLVFTEGSDWARHRRILNPAFNLDKLKMLAVKMTECTKIMLKVWQDEAVEKEIEVSKEFIELTADIISHTAFGSSFAEGKEVFAAQRELGKLFQESRLKLDIPGSKYIPTKGNIRRWQLERILRRKMMGIIQGRLKSNCGYGNDLLGLMIESRNKQEGQMLSMEEIIDECKTFFLAGHETTSSLLTWAVFLLSIHEPWQEKLREEVLQECGTKTPNANTLIKLKLLNMVLLETLRLYSPAVRMLRKATKDMNLKGLKVPKETTLVLPLMMTHRSKEIWGADAGEFNPMRFENGTSKAAKHPNAFLAFSVGPRACIGQNFAMLEAKMVMAMILQRFSFTLSPNYKHLPAFAVTLHPKYGLPIIFKPLLL